MKYSYNGPVSQFDKCITNNWTAETIASSEKKALSNFKYRFKKENNMASNSKIDLPGRITIIEED